MSEPGSTPKSPLGFDEIIAIFVAFSTLGTIFILSFPSTERGLNIFETRTGSPSAETTTPTGPTPQPLITPPVTTPQGVPPLSPQSTNPLTSPGGTSTSNPSAWGAFALPLFSPPETLDSDPGEAATEGISREDETQTLTSPMDQETGLIETTNPESSPLATPNPETTVDPASTPE
jgi:hypothetical protein